MCKVPMPMVDATTALRSCALCSDASRPPARGSPARRDARVPPEIFSDAARPLRPTGFDALRDFLRSVQRRRPAIEVIADDWIVSLRLLAMSLAACAAGTLYEHSQVSAGWWRLGRSSAFRAACSWQTLRSSRSANCGAINSPPGAVSEDNAVKI
jgi:hypothetical protein